MKTITSIIYPALALFAFACFALSPTVQAVSPPPDGGYPGFNTAEGEDALFSLTTGLHNTAVGWHALYTNVNGNGNTATGRQALLNNTADANTATGYSALFSNTTGIQNTATGVSALQNNTTGNWNTAIGVNALISNTTADANTATGFQALFSNTTGTENTATGYEALYSNTTGFNNTATGIAALYSNTTGDRNTATGRVALVNNTTGRLNTAAGNGALLSNTTGFRNTATGQAALLNNTTGPANTADGDAALFNNVTGFQNTAVGESALFNSTGFLNTALGYAAGDFTTGNNNIVLGNLGVAAESDTIRIGVQVAATDEFGNPHPAHTATYVAGINGTTISRGAAVFVDANGRLGTRSSSQRFKTRIKPMDKASEAILALEPVTFHYKKEIDPDQVPQFGLVAEDVEKVNPDLVVRDAEGKVYSVRYEAVNAMLLNEFLKEHRTVQEQQKEIDALRAELKEQRALIRKVNDKVELSRPAPQTVANDQ
jgi:hypothetical protein